MVVVQEMIAPPDLRVLPASPYFGDEHMPYFPNSNQRLKPNDRTTAFFHAMYDVGFDRFEMSPEDTGPGPKNRINSTATEWWVVFYRSTKFEVARHLRNDYLSRKRAANPKWDRVPYAFSFRCLAGDQQNTTDFTLLSAHLHTGPSKANAEKRKRELAALYSWIKNSKSKDSERDYFIIGDLNIENARELSEATSGTNFHSLNTLAQFPTNTNINGPKPYDHVIFSPGDTTEVQPLRNFEVLDLLTLTQDDWFASPYQSPANPYVHNQFRMYYSDHNPIAFDLVCSADDD